MQVYTGSLMSRPPIAKGSAAFLILSLLPRLWLPLDEGSGTTPQDISGNGNHGAFINSPTWDAGPPVSLDFQAADTDGLLISGLLGSPAAVTICSWVDVGAVASQPRVLSIGNAAEIILTSDGFGATHFDGGFQSLLYSGGSLAGGGPLHLAAVIDPGAERQEIYLNGVSVGTASLSAAINYAGTGIPNTYVGQLAGSLPYDGRGRHVLAFPFGLSTQQIEAVMAATA